jgi:hypothetical protein
MAHRLIFPVAFIAVTALLMSGCSSPPSPLESPHASSPAGASSHASSPAGASSDVPSNDAAGNNPFHGLPTPQPAFNANFDPNTTWSGTIPAGYMTYDISFCKSLGLDAYAARLTSEPGINDFQYSDWQYHCAWTDVEADITAPQVYGADTDRPELKTGNPTWATQPNNWKDLGTLSLGDDSDLMKVPIFTGATIYLGSVHTAGAAYMLSFLEDKSSVPDAFYIEAQKKMLKQMMKVLPVVGQD